MNHDARKPTWLEKPEFLDPFIIFLIDYYLSTVQSALPGVLSDINNFLLTARRSRHYRMQEMIDFNSLTIEWNVRMQSIHQVLLQAHFCVTRKSPGIKIYKGEKMSWLVLSSHKLPESMLLAIERRPYDYICDCCYLLDCLAIMLHDLQDMNSELSSMFISQQTEVSNIQFEEIYRRLMKSIILSSLHPMAAIFYSWQCRSETNTAHKLLEDQCWRHAISSTSYLIETDRIKDGTSQLIYWEKMANYISHTVHPALTQCYQLWRSKQFHPLYKRLGKLYVELLLLLNRPYICLSTTERMNIINETWMHAVTSIMPHFMFSVNEIIFFEPAKSFSLTNSNYQSKEHQEARRKWCIYDMCLFRCITYLQYLSGVCENTDSHLTCIHTQRIRLYSQVMSVWFHATIADDRQLVSFHKLDQIQLSRVLDQITVVDRIEDCTSSTSFWDFSQQALDHLYKSCAFIVISKSDILRLYSRRLLFHLYATLAILECDKSSSPQVSNTREELKAYIQSIVHNSAVALESLSNPKLSMETQRMHSIYVVSLLRYLSYSHGLSTYSIATNPIEKEIDEIEGDNRSKQDWNQWKYLEAKLKESLHINDDNGDENDNYGMDSLFDTDVS